jgi:hypothetical protein
MVPASQWYDLCRLTDDEEKAAGCFDPADILKDPNTLPEVVSSRGIILCDYSDSEL